MEVKSEKSDEYDKHASSKFPFIIYLLSIGPSPESGTSQYSNPIPR